MNKSLPKIKTIILLFLAACSLFAFKTAKAANPTLDDEEKKFVTLLNDYRKELGLNELKVSKKVLLGTDYFAEDFANHPDNSDVQIHISSEGIPPEERGQKYGYSFLSENMGWGYETAQQIFDAWKASSGHDKNMTMKEGRTMGISRVYKPGATKNGELVEWFWVLDLSDEGVERLKGNSMKKSNLYKASDYKYKQMDVTVKRKDSGKKKQYAEIRVSEINKKGKVVRQVDYDITNKKGQAKLFSNGKKYVQVKCYKTKGSKKAVATRKIKWNKRVRLNFKV